MFAKNGNRKASNLNIGIVGGSIAGCSAAITLTKAGHQVTVFERSRNELVGRGAGIGTTVGMIELLIEKGMLDEDFPYFQLNEMPFVGRRDADDRLGHTAWNMPINIALLNWGDLYQNLRKRVSDEVYFAGKTATSASSVQAVSVDETPDNKTLLTLDDGTQHTFDLLIFADGYRSMGRQLLFPEVPMNYRGYVLWRGVLEEKELADSTPLETAIPRLSYKGMPGHLVLYFVPGQDGSIKPGERWVNWAAYIPVTDDELPAFLVDKNGKQHSHSMPPGLMRPEEENRLKQLMRDHLPTYYADIISVSSNTFAQPIYNVDMPGYHNGRICLFGDAGAVAQPFTGSGVFKGVNNALDLVAKLEETAQVEEALAQWDAEQTAAGKRLVVLGEQMEQAWIWAAVDFAQMEPAETEQWFKTAVTFPEEFSYEK